MAILRLSPAAASAALAALAALACTRPAQAPGPAPDAAAAAQPPRYAQASPDLNARAVAPTRSDDLDVPTFIRKKAD